MLLGGSYEHLTTICQTRRQAMAEDAAKVAPHVYKVVFENERARVLEVRMKAGEARRCTRIRTTSCTSSAAVR